MSLTLERIPPAGCFGSEWTAQVEPRFLIHIFSITMVVVILLERYLSRLCIIYALLLLDIY